ncbi:S8 family peptidase [Streptomyces sp. NPDC048604]|uniref:S8 family peptidase n=1 Tax=Streptomyces sp. NPDC048604 TaxID=3365578 RepID=UPI00371D50FE
MRLSAHVTAAAFLLALPLAAAAPSAADAPVPSPVPAPLRASADAIPGQYIVTLSGGQDAAALAAQVPGVKALHTYSSVLNGFAAKLTPAQLDAVRRTPGVAAVEEDATVKVGPVAARRSVVAQSWGLDRIDQPYLPLDNRFDVGSDGRGVAVFVVDTGLDYGHQEFAGRAWFGYDAVGDGRQGADCNGHGTHVAGTAGGASFGVARAADLVSVRVLDCQGSGSYSGMIAGFDYVGRQADAGVVGVLNGSLGGARSQALNDAVDAVAAKGILPVVAAGNSSLDACQISPASAERVLTVGATDHRDRETDFSNFGPCLEIYAPGAQIVSARRGGGSMPMDGTSMAAPHVAGVAALYKAAHPAADANTVRDWVLEHGAQDVLTVSKGSPNLLLQSSDL